MNFQKLSSFFEVVGLSIYGNDKFLQNTRKMWFYVANHGKTFMDYYEVFQKA